MTTVYPRVCGGTPSPALAFGLPIGLSPRVRGNLLRSGHDKNGSRSIPACAGEPWARRRWLGFCPGLSPRVRGNLRVLVPGPPPPGSIPACAGEPLRSSTWRCGSRVYPRVCGGTSGRSPAHPTSPGLSPRVRGNLASGQGGDDPGGSIPACAGEPVSDEQRMRIDRVYPRVCGGTQARPARRKSTAGLSPRVRGNLPPAGVGEEVHGSIPACAGEPRHPSDRVPQCAVYPRVCGGTADRHVARSLRVGLSPRVRGNLEIPESSEWWWGSIPACAGEPTGVALRHARP